MRCADVRSNLFRYSEGAAGRWWAIRMRMHIARCGACREEMETLRGSQRRLAAALQEPVQAPDISRLVMPLLRTSPSPSVRRSVWKPAAAFAVVAVLVIVCIMILPQSRHSQQPRVAKDDSKASVVRHNIETDVRQETVTSERIDVPVTSTVPGVVSRPEARQPDSKEQVNTHRHSHRPVHPKQITEPNPHPVPEETPASPEPAAVDDDQPVAIAVVIWPGSKEEPVTSYGYEERNNDTGVTTTCSVNRSENSVNVYLESKAAGKRPEKGEIRYEKNRVNRFARLGSHSNYR